MLGINPNLMLWVLKHLRTRWCDTQDCVLSTNSFWRLWTISLSSGQWLSLLYGHKARTPFHGESPQIPWKPFCGIKPNQKLYNVQPVNVKQSPPLASFQVSALSPKQRKELKGAPDRGCFTWVKYSEVLQKLPMAQTRLNFSLAGWKKNYHFTLIRTRVQFILYTETSFSGNIFEGNFKSTSTQSYSNWFLTSCINFQ